MSSYVGNLVAFMSLPSGGSRRLACLRLDYGPSTPGLGTTMRAVAPALSIRTFAHARVVQPETLSRVKPSSCFNSTIHQLRLFHFHSLALHIHHKAIDTPHSPVASLDCAVLLDNYSIASLRQII